MAAAIFLAEVAALGLVRAFGPLPETWSTVLELLVAFLVTVPIAHGLAFRPLQRHIDDLDAAERELERANAQLEARVAHRTGELAVANAALAAERDVLDVIFENTRAHLAYLDPQLEVVRVNSGFAGLFGLHRAEMVGRNLAALFPDGGIEALAAEVGATAAAAERHGVAMRSSFGPEPTETFWDRTLAPVTRSDGRIEGLVFSMTETTAAVRAAREREALLEGIDEQRRQAEANAADARRRAEAIAAILEAMVEPVLILDTEGVVTRANRSALALLEFDPVGLHRATLRDRLAASGPGGLPLGTNDFLPVGSPEGDAGLARRYLVTSAISRTTCVIDASTAPLVTAGEWFGTVSVWRDVSEREALLDQIIAERSRLRTVIESITDAYVAFDADWRVLEVNHVAENSLFRRPAAELVGQRLREVESVLVDDRFERECRRAHEEGVAVHFEARSGGVDGRWFEAHAYPRYRRTELYLRDITERKRAEEALRESEEKFRLIAESSAEDIWQLDLEGRITYASPAQERMFGYPPDRLATLRFADFIAASDIGRAADAFARAVAGERFQSLELTARRKDGTTLPIEVSVTPVVKSGAVVGVQGIARDVSERKRAEATLTRAFEETRRHQRETAALLDAARAVLSRPDFAEAADGILTACRSIVGASGGFIALLDEAGTAAAVVRADVDWRPLVAASGRSLPTIPLPEPDAAIEADEIAFRAERLRLPPELGAAVSRLAAPVAIGDRAHGLLMLLDKPDGFTDNDGKVATAFAELAAVALLNSRTLELLADNQETLAREVRERTAQLEDANVSLRAERQRLFSLLEELPLFVLLRRPDHTVAFVNRYFREHFGEPNGNACFEALAGRREPCEGCLAGCVADCGTPADREWTAPSGRSYHIHVYPFTDADGSHLVLELGIDITERRRALLAEQGARRTADTLREAGLALTRTLDVDTVLVTLLDHLRSLVPYDRARVHLLDGEGRFTVRAVLTDDRVGPLPEGERPSFDAHSNPVLRQIIASRVPLVIPDIRLHADWGLHADPSHEPSWLGVPLTARDQVIGLFSLSKNEPSFFTDEHVRVAEALAGQASVSVHNALLFEQVQAARERLQVLSRRLVDVQENERRAVARELHDEAGQALASLLFGLRVLERDSMPAPGLAHQVAELRRTADGVLEDLHRLAADLRPASLDHLGLEAALRQHITSVHNTFGLDVRFKARGLGGAPLPLAIETALYRAVQEALTNVVRHARANTIDVLAERRGERVFVMVEDDGVGFDVDARVNGGRLGLVGLQERAEALGGTLRVESSPGNGTTVVLEVPCVDPHPDR